MAAKNSTILGRIWLNGTNDYQQRVPNPTQSRVSETVNAIFAPMNKDIYNQFIDGFINLIGQQRVNDSIWENPLTPFKGASLTYGSTIQESAPKWIKAHAYDDASETLLKMERPEFAVWYYSVNREDRYDISISRPELQKAFRDEYGLNRLINATMNVPINSDNYDEYLLMINLLAEYQSRWGFYVENMTEPTDEVSGKAFLAKLRAYANKLSFPTTQYSPIGAVEVPVFAKPNELILLISADVDASVDVNTLASVFQLDLANIKYRKIVVPEFPIEGAYALLTTDAFFVVNDFVYQTTSFYNAEQMATKYYLHHWETVACSPFVPAILFSSAAAATSLTTVKQTVSKLTLTVSETSIGAGDTTQLTAALTGALAADPTTGEVPESVEVAPDAYTVELSAKDADGNALDLNSRTYVDRLGVLHTQKSGWKEGANTVTVKATSTYIDPSSATTTAQTATVEITVNA